MGDRSTYFGKEGENISSGRRIAYYSIFGLAVIAGISLIREGFPGRSESNLEQDTNTTREIIEKYDSNRNGELDQREILRALRDKYIK